MIVYVLSGKQTKVKVGFTDDWDKLLTKAQKEDKSVKAVVKENYTSKKHALIRVKQLKKQLLQRR